MKIWVFLVVFTTWGGSFVGVNQWLLCWGEPMASRARPLRGALGRAPPPVCRVEILKKFTGKSVPENYTLFFLEKTRFSFQNVLNPI